MKRRLLTGSAVLVAAGSLLGGCVQGGAGTQLELSSTVHGSTAVIVLVAHSAPHAQLRVVTHIGDRVIRQLVVTDRAGRGGTTYTVPTGGRSVSVTVTASQTGAGSSNTATVSTTVVGGSNG